MEIANSAVDTALNNSLFFLIRITKRRNRGKDFISAESIMNIAEENKVSTADVQRKIDAMWHEVQR